jgi:two-component sensor histidine kinase
VNTEAPRLLYIDDDEGLCRLVQRGMQRRGYAVDYATSGPEGVERIGREPFDLVALDHYMPGQDGLATLAEIRAIDAAPPVIFVTGSDESRIAVAALKDGAVDYVVKSASDDFLDLLASALDQALAQVKLTRERDAATLALQAANARLNAIVQRQEVMIREVNHRVANSLQLVSSLVHMQGMAVKDESARHALRDTQARIGAIMQIHKRLYTSDDVEAVDMRDYLEGLVEDLRKTVGDADGKTLHLDADPILLKTDKAVSVGVIVAELATNACKYAYAPGAMGEVRIRLDQLSEGKLKLVVEDDGEGMPATGTAAKGTGLGQTVVNAMARSLNACIAFDPHHKGARAVVEFDG